MTNEEKMTPEEAIICLQGLLENPLINKGSYLAQALEMAIQALSQEPCDAVSREAVYQLLMNMASSAYGFEEIRRIVDDLPSVTQKSGKWIDHSYEEGYVECPFCGSATNCEDNIDELHYCFFCGAELSGEEQTE